MVNLRVSFLQTSQTTHIPWFSTPSVVLWWHNWPGARSRWSGVAVEFSWPRRSARWSGRWFFLAFQVKSHQKNHQKSSKYGEGAIHQGGAIFFGRHFLKSSLSLLHLIQYYPCRRGLRRVSHWSLMYLGYSRPEEMIKLLLYWGFCEMYVFYLYTHISYSHSYESHT